MATPSIAPLDLGALHRLKLTEPPVWLAPTAELSDAAREASRQLFSFLKSHTPKSPLDQLLVEGFDAEQIWQQIDLLSQPLLYGLKREVKKFEKNPDEIGKIRKVLEGERKDFEREKEINELEQYLEEDEAREYGLKKDVINDKKKVRRKLGVFGEGDEDDGDMDQLGTARKLQSEIEKMEKANMDQKAWTMQGEVTAAQRPKNSALEVDLDFQHNVRPAPVITEEFTTSLEEMIKKRILEGQFDDAQKIFTLPSKAPRELNELDENKSKKGLAEVYEEEFVQKTNPAAAPLLFSDEQKKEASMLFKKLCLKLDALSHFHFTPKPVIEDMSIQMNVPALAMEEIAPIAVSDAAMLAPEEVFSSKGDVKEETELTQADRKRRRANKKRKFKAKAAERSAKRAQDNTSLNHNDVQELYYTKMIGRIEELPKNYGNQARKKVRVTLITSYRFRIVEKFW
ncbi:hypothetical protein EZV62_016040 [Acer yangbiense]|uniref:Uncharacterized protein n=1 Tax=Acer yangbiense TaxID=1000413 RepID=A0A5C7HMH2_9ROSI|nr:hypothetical protein EZV62_016040 [Acer yangbiense]